jgi:ABC-type phosphate/phosphonate transport system substrate-binding protein
MKKLWGRGATILAALLGLMLLPAAPAEEGAVSATIKIGLVDTITRGIPPSWTQIAMRPFKALMEEQTGMTGEVVMGGDALHLAKDLQDNKVQVGVFHGHEYAWAKQKYPGLKAIALCVNRWQQAKVHLMVRTDSTAASYADLKGKKIAVPRLGRAPCRIYLERRCVPPGTTPEKFYVRVETPFAVADALEDLVDGEVAAAVVDAAGLEEYRKAYVANARRLRCIAESEPFPCGVIACFPGRLSDSKMSKFSAGLLSAPTTSRGKDTLRVLRLTAFELPPANHNAVLEAIAKAYPAPSPTPAK